jgi:hypothetical protein
MPCPRIYNLAAISGGGGGGTPTEAIDEIKHYSFNFSTASPINAIALSANVRVLTVAMKIITPFDNPGAEIKVGFPGDDDGYMTFDQNVPQETGEYETNPFRYLASAENVILTINPAGSTQGEGLLIIEVDKPTT